MRPRLTLWQGLVHLAAWTPAVWLAADALTDQLTANPIQAAIQRTGKTALALLLFSLACTPLSRFGFRPVLKVRRALGLYAFLYAALHFSLFIGVDYQFQLDLIWADARAKPYLWVGFTAGLILLALAATSFQWWMKRLGKNWKRLHRLVYLAGVLVIFHYAWAKKGNFFTLGGEMAQPSLFGLALLLLLALRFRPKARFRPQAR